MYRLYDAIVNHSIYSFIRLFKYTVIIQNFIFVKQVNSILLVNKDCKVGNHYIKVSSLRYLKISNTTCIQNHKNKNTQFLLTRLENAFYQLIIKVKVKLIKQLELI